MPSYVNVNQQLVTPLTGETPSDITNPIANPVEDTGKIKSEQTHNTLNLVREICAEYGNSGSRSVGTRAYYFPRTSTRHNLGIKVDKQASGGVYLTTDPNSLDGYYIDIGENVTLTDQGEWYLVNPSPTIPVTIYFIHEFD